MGGSSKPRGPSQAEIDAERSRAAEIERMRMDNEMMQRTGAERLAAMLRVRGGSRALLSEARINPEQGVTTLGQSPKV